MLSTFIHPRSRGVCRETCTKFRRIDCRSFLSERNTSSSRSYIRARRRRQCMPVHVYTHLRSYTHAEVHARAEVYTTLHVYTSLYSRLDEISVSSIRRRVLREFKIPLTTPRYPDTRYKSYCARAGTHTPARTFSLTPT